MNQFFADKDLSLIVPDKLYISDVMINAKQVTFNWSPVAPDCPVHYTILSSNCGSCPTTTTNTTVTCTDLPSDGGVCTFAVQTVPCGLISGEWTDNITLYLIPYEYGMHALHTITSMIIAYTMVTIVNMYSGF